jgi:hypothetical protein
MPLINHARKYVQQNCCLHPNAQVSAAYVFVQSPGISVPFISALDEGIARSDDTVMDLWVYRITSVARNHIGLLAAAAICTTGILARRREESIVISR